MMQNMYIAYMRGFEKNLSKYIKGSLVEKNDKGKKQSK
jgi:hypothetical protein